MSKMTMGQGLFGANPADPTVGGRGVRTLRSLPRRFLSDLGALGVGVGSGAGFSLLFAPRGSWLW